MDLFINAIVNLYRGFITTYYLTNTLGSRNSKRFIYGVGTVSLFVVMEILAWINVFEPLKIVLLFVSVLVLAVKLFGKDNNKKLMHAILITLIVVCVGLLVESIVTMFIESNIESDKYTYLLKYAGLLLSQVVLYIAVKYEIKYVEYNEKGINSLYSILAMTLASISAFIVAMLQRVVMGESNDLLYGGAIFAGVILLVAVSLVIYGIGQKTYADKMHRELEIAVYKRQEYDINELNNTVHQIEKVRHEFNKVCVTAQELLADGKCKEAENFLRKFYDEEVQRINRVNYTDNIIMNYILNQKIEKCKRLGIDVKYVINGSVSGIDDVDLHCIMTNLWDNAIEATQELENKEISFYVFGDEDCINIEISNTVKGDVPAVNWNTKTTKKDSNGHGYGMINIKNVVDKYQGVCEYKHNKVERLTCKILLIKDFATKN